MALFYHYTADEITVEGQTYPHRERLKALGARFHGQRKVWQLPNTPPVLDSIKILCQQLGGGAVQTLIVEEEEEEEEEVVLSDPAVVLSDPAVILSEAKDLLSSHSVEARLNDSLSVSQLMALINGVIYEKFPAAVWVVGEVQGINHRSNVSYFTLAEQDQQQRTSASATASALLWRSAYKTLEKRYGAAELKEVLQDGLQIRCLCQISVYAGRGTISLNVVDIDPSFTKGALALAREKLLKELRAKGLDRTNKQQYLTPIPLRLGLISAEGSRAHGDFLHQLADGGFPGEVLFVAMPMQGSKVALAIKKALNVLCAKNCDLIIITRGGGSAADLQAFDSPEVAYAIAACPLPVIAAIGHHDDYCVAEEICYQRRKTPTAAADFVVEIFATLRHNLLQMGQRMGEQLDRALNRVTQQQLLFADRLTHSAGVVVAKKRERLAALGARVEKNFLQVIFSLQQTLERTLLRRLDQGISRQWDKKTAYLESLAQQVSSRDPSPWLQKGWTCLQGPRGRIKSIADCSVGEELRARVIDGTLVLGVKAVAGKAENSETR